MANNIKVPDIKIVDNVRTALFNGMKSALSDYHKILMSKEFRDFLEEEILYMNNDLGCKRAASHILERLSDIHTAAQDEIEGIEELATTMPYKNLLQIINDKQE